MELIISERIAGVEKKEGKKEAYEIIRDITSGINVTLESLNFNEQGWVEIKFSGDDSDLLIELLRREFGIAPAVLSKIDVGDILRGFIVEINKKYLKLDIGIFSPEYKYGLYSLFRLQSQLLDGLKFSMEKAINQFCFHEGMPLEIRVVKVNDDGIDLELSDEQINYLKEWERIPVERIIFLNSLSKNIHNAVRMAKVDMDIMKKEKKGLTTHILSCKIGKKADGVISEIIPFLKRGRFFLSKGEHYKRTW